MRTKQILVGFISAMNFIWVNSNDTFWGKILQFHLDLNKG